MGVPPGLDSPGPLSRFANTHPEIDLRYRELQFPGRSTSDWLSDVDIAVTHVPPPDENIWTQRVRSEPRAVLVPRSHPLADRSELSVSEVLDEAFIGYSDQVDPTWAGFWSLDDHRGGPPLQVTTDQAAGPQEVLAALAVRDAITTVPASSAAVLVNFLTGLTSIPLTDADPTTFVLTGRLDRDNPLVESYREFARGAEGPEVDGRRPRPRAGDRLASTSQSRERVADPQGKSQRTRTRSGRTRRPGSRYSGYSPRSAVDLVVSQVQRAVWHALECIGRRARGQHKQQRRTTVFKLFTRPVAFTAVIVLVVIGLAGCGESSEEKATAQVCSSTKAIQAQLSKLSELSISSKTIEEVKSAAGVMETEAAKIKESAPNLPASSKAPVEAAQSALKTELAGLATALVSAAKSSGSIEAVLKQSEPAVKAVGGRSRRAATRRPLNRSNAPRAL